MQDRSLFIFATPRSGSTALHNIISYYLKQTEDRRSLSSVFNPKPVEGYTLLDDRLLLSRTGKQVDLRNRVRMVKTTPQNYFFKVFPWHLRPSVISMLKQNHRAILLERKNCFAQALSFLISMETNKWAFDGKKPAPKKSLVADHGNFKFIEKEILSFHKLKKQFRQAKYVHYEDLDFSKPSEIVQKIGLRQKVNWKDFKKSKQQNPEFKLNFFENRAEILNWYLKSPLSELYQINDSDLKVT